MRIDCEKVRALKDALLEINLTPFDELEFYENGVKINIEKNIREDFKFTGLNNTDFVSTEFWKEECRENRS